MTTASGSDAAHTRPSDHGVERTRRTTAVQERYRRDAGRNSVLAVARAFATADGATGLAATAGRPTALRAGARRWRWYRSSRGCRPTRRRPAAACARPRRRTRRRCRGSGRPAAAGRCPRTSPRRAGRAVPRRPARGGRRAGTGTRSRFRPPRAPVTYSAACAAEGAPRTGAVRSGQVRGSRAPSDMGITHPTRLCGRASPGMLALAIRTHNLRYVQGVRSRGVPRVRDSRRRAG